MYNHGEMKTVLMRSFWGFFRSFSEARRGNVPGFLPVAVGEFNFNFNRTVGKAVVKGLPGRGGGGRVPPWKPLVGIPVYVVASTQG